jgi:hypothetical protein
MFVTRMLVRERAGGERGSEEAEGERGKERKREREREFFKA